MISFTKDVFPDFMVIGAQKGGTSSLHYYLNQHPKLVGSRPKELHYFDIKKYQNKDLKWYMSHFKKPLFSSKKYFETTPSYIYHEKIAKEIYFNKPDIKLIVSLRNPVQRAYSAWNMYRQIFNENRGEIFNKKDLNHNIYNILYKDRNSFPSFEECIDIELFNTFELEPAILRRGFYCKQIENYLKYFPIENIKIVDSNELLQNTLIEFNKICDFLEVKNMTEFDLILKQKHKREYSNTIDSETRNKLVQLYSEPNSRLYKLINKNFNWD